VIKYNALRDLVDLSCYCRLSDMCEFSVPLRHLLALVPPDTEHFLAISRRTFNFC
jgi:hypothetical protein